VRVEVRVVEAIVVPAEPLSEVEAADENARLGHESLALGSAGLAGSERKRKRPQFIGATIGRLERHVTRERDGGPNVIRCCEPA